MRHALNSVHQWANETINFRWLTKLTEQEKWNTWVQMLYLWTYYAWYQLLHLYARAFCTRSTVATVALVFKLCEGSCTGSLNNRPVWKICLTTKSGRLCVSLRISHWKYVALQVFFLVTLRLIKWIIWIQCWEIELFVTDFAIFTGTGCWNISNCIFNCFYCVMSAECFFEIGRPF